MGEQVLVDHVADGAVVRVAVEQVDGAREHRQQRVQVVRDDEDRHVGRAMEVGEQRDDLVLVAHVEVGERLVEQQQVGLADERLRDRDPLLLPARELGQAPVCELARADAARAPRRPEPARRTSRRAGPSGGP